MLEQIFKDMIKIEININYYLDIEKGKVAYEETKEKEN